MRRSEEHTSELQSPDHLVCRLLLEKKKASQDAPIQASIHIAEQVSLLSRTTLRAHRDVHETSMQKNSRTTTTRPCRHPNYGRHSLRAIVSSVILPPLTRRSNNTRQTLHMLPSVRRASLDTLPALFPPLVFSSHCPRRHQFLFFFF